MRKNVCGITLKLEQLKPNFFLRKGGDNTHLVIGIV